MKAKHTYWIVYEYFPAPEGETDKRRIYTFHDEDSAHSLVEFLIRSDKMTACVGVEPYETTT